MAQQPDPSRSPIDDPASGVDQVSPADRGSQPQRAPSLVHIGGLGFLLTAGIGRLPAAMIQLGILLFVTGAGGGLARGGVAVAALGIGSAVGAPLVGRLVDRFGALRVLVVATCLQLAAMAGLLVIDVSGGLTPLLALSLLLGAANPQVGAAARGRWSQLARMDLSRAHGDRLVSRAMGYESAVDEAGFVLGPAIAGALIGGLGAHLGLVVVAAITLVGQGAFAGYCVRHPIAPTAPADGARGTLPWAAVVRPMLAGIAVGMCFGGTQTALTSHFEALDQAGLTGAVYALVGVGSATSSVLAGRLSPRVRLGLRVLVGGLLILLAAGAAAYATGLHSSGLALLIVAMVLLGLGVGPVLVTGFTWMEQLAPRESLTTAMTLMATSIVIGVSLSASIGASLTTPGGNQALWLVAAAAVVVIGNGTTALLRHRD